MPQETERSVALGLQLGGVDGSLAHLADGLHRQGPVNTATVVLMPKWTLCTQSQCLSKQLQYQAMQIKVKRRYALSCIGYSAAGTA